MLRIVVMDLEAIASQKGDAWHTSAAAAAARMRSSEGFFILRLSAADAAVLQVRLQQARLLLHSPAACGPCRVLCKWPCPTTIYESAIA